MVQRQVRQLLAVAFAISVFTAMSVAPVAASSGIGDDDDGIGSGGWFGGDDDGGDEGGDISVGESLEDDESDGDGSNDGDGGGSVGPSSSGDVESDSIDGGLEDLSLEFGNLSDGGDGFDGIGGDRNESGNVSLPHPTDIEFDTNDIPEDQRPFTQFLQSLPETNETGPEDFPIGDERALINICDPLDLEADDLPIGLIPGLNDLPDALQLPGLPYDLITPEAIVGIILGFIPAPCEIFNPNDPQIDPTDPPDEPRAQFDVARFGGQDGGAVGLVTYEGTLNDSGVGPSIEGQHGTLLTPEYGDIDHELILNDGKNDYGLDTRIRYNENRTSFEAVLVLLGKRAGIDVNCKTLQNYDGNLITLDFEKLEENPLGPCDYELIGLPNLIGPGDLFGIINDLADNEEPIIDPFGALPINFDALLNL